MAPSAASLMARDPSPLSQRLKALAVRAGLPVDTGSSAPTAPPAEDEQPTGEFPAVAASDTPEEDRPTGEFPAIAEETPSAEGEASPAEVEATAEAAPEPEVVAGPDAELPAVPAPIWGSPPEPSSAPSPPPVRDDAPAPPPPIWTDSPAESQSPPPATEAPVDGPTLSPPTLSKPEQLHEALALPDTEPAPDAGPEPEEQPTIAQPHIGADLTPVPEPEPAPQPVEDAEPLTSAFGAVSIDGGELHGQPSDDAQQPPEAAERVSEPEVTPPGGNQPGEEPAETPVAARAKERLGLTGRFAALRRRVTPSAETATTNDVAPATDDQPEPQPATAEPAAPEPVAVAAAAAAPIAEPSRSASQEPHPAKPSFSERAALRRRVKTLRARRDTGLLELGAIVLDQRRFGDPTAGALLRRRTDELGDLDNEIAAIEHALDDHASAAAVAALGAIRCVSCSSLVGPSDRFCAHCGTPRPTGGTPPSASSADQAS